MSVGKLNKPKTEINTVLGIDASTNSVAYCLYGKDGPVKWGEIHFKGATVFERLGDSQSKCKDGLSELNPDMIVFEAATFINNKKTVIQLAYVFGSILGAIMKPGIIVDDLVPVVWQKAIGNPPFTKEEKIELEKEYPDKSESWISNKIREMRKQRTIDIVKEKFDIEAKNDNIGDAIAISHVAFQKFGS